MEKYIRFLSSMKYQGKCSRLLYLFHDAIFIARVVSAACVQMFLLCGVIAGLDEYSNYNDAEICSFEEIRREMRIFLTTNFLIAFHSWIILTIHSNIGFKRLSNMPIFKS